MASFIESEICKSRQHCVPCRRDAGFRENFEKQLGGSWTCPLNIPIDASDSDFPKDILDRYNEYKKQIEERQRIMMEAQAAFEELSMAMTGDNIARLEKIRSAFFPNTKTAMKCVNGIKQIGDVDQVCCGGTVKKVAAYECKKHTLCTDRKCQGCSDFAPKK